MKDVPMLPTSQGATLTHTHTHFCQDFQQAHSIAQPVTLTSQLTPTS